jgi:tetratricopeptide (TPR) repeat protein
MKTLTAFVAKSFRPEDREKTEIVEQFLDRFKRLGFFWTTAEQAEVESVSQKVRDLIDRSDAFVGILTKRHPLYENVRGVRNRLLACFNRMQPRGWSAPPWVLQESGYALKAGKPLILFREADVDIGGLQGDLEYISYDPERPDAALARAHEMVNGLIARESSIKVEVITQAAIPPVEPHEVPTSAVPAEPSTEEGASLSQAFDQLGEAIVPRDLLAAEAAFAAGLTMIDPTDASKITKWKSFYYCWTYKIGRESSLADLADLQSNNPTDPAPTVLLAVVYKEFQQYDNAAHAYEQASGIAVGEDSALFLVRRAECLRNARRWEAARSQLERVLATPALSPTLRVTALKELYSVLKELSEEEPAFAIGELILVNNPGDRDFRFTLAYDCQSRHPSLALYHYELICGQRAEALTLNNLGYAYQENGLAIHGTRKYKEAADLKLSRAFRNLGMSYADAGLADDALVLLEGAKDISDPEDLIPQALASIHSQISNEETKRTEIIESTRQHREFLSVAGEALLASPDVPVSGEWAFPFADVNLLRNGKQVDGEGVKLSDGATISLSRLLSSQMLAGSSHAPDPVKGKTTFHFNGNLAGRLCRFTVTVKISYDNPYMSNETGETVRGYIAFEPDGTSARVGEYKGDKPINFYRITKRLD